MVVINLKLVTLLVSFYAINADVYSAEKWSPPLKFDGTHKTRVITKRSPPRYSDDQESYRTNSEPSHTITQSSHSSEEDYDSETGSENDTGSGHLAPSFNGRPQGPSSTFHGGKRGPPSSIGGRGIGPPSSFGGSKSGSLSSYDGNKRGPSSSFSRSTNGPPTSFMGSENGHSPSVNGYKHRHGRNGPFHDDDESEDEYSAHGQNPIQAMGMSGYGRNVGNGPFGAMAPFHGRSQNPYEHDDYDEQRGRDGYNRSFDRNGRYRSRSRISSGSSSRSSSSSHHRYGVKTQRNLRGIQFQIGRWTPLKITHETTTTNIPDTPWY